MFGYWGRIAIVDLTNRIIRIIKVNENFFKKYLGGVGVAAKLILDYVDPTTDPLSPDNILVFSVGPFQGTVIPGSGKWIVAARSPLTGIWADSAAGGRWGSEFKRTGFDALVIKGKASSPIYLWIHDREIEFRDAAGIWGMSVSRCTDVIKKDLNDSKAAVACIGQAGENLVKFANILSEHGVAGRGGLGAVMGSKNLKAVAVRGTMNVELADPEKLIKYSKEISIKMYEYTREGFRKYGTTASVPKYIDRFGYGLAKYWSEGMDSFSPTLDGISGDKFLEITVNPVACTSCPIACHRHTRVKEPESLSYDGYGPEYETIAMFGWLNMISNAKAVGYLNYLCDEYGMDTITTASVLGLVTLSYEKGWITKDDLDGIDIKWGDISSAINLVNKIAKREGVGSILAEGIIKVAEYIGHEAPDYILHSKGLDYPAHDPRAFFPLLLNYATGPRGACHQRGFPQWTGLGVLIPEWGISEPPDRYTMENSAYLVAKYQNWATIFNSLVQCEYMVFGGYQRGWLTHQINFLKYVTGWDINANSIDKIAERIFTLQRVLNIRWGISRKDDIPPNRIFTPLKVGKSAGKIPIMFEKALMEYYKLRGWDEDGKPTVETLVKLSLTECLKPIWD